MDTIIPITDFSFCDKLFRITVLVLRFVKNLKIKAKLLKEGTVYLGEVTAEELGNAEVKWLRSVQKVPSKLQSVRARLWSVRRQ